MAFSKSSERQAYPCSQFQRHNLWNTHTIAIHGLHRHGMMARAPHLHRCDSPPPLTSNGRRPECAVHAQERFAGHGAVLGYARATAHGGVRGHRLRHPHGLLVRRTRSRFSQAVGGVTRSGKRRRRARRERSWRGQVSGTRQALWRDGRVGVCGGQADKKAGPTRSITTGHCFDHHARVWITRMVNCGQCQQASLDWSTHRRELNFTH